MTAAQALLRRARIKYCFQFSRFVYNGARSNHSPLKLTSTIAFFPNKASSYSQLRNYRSSSILKSESSTSLPTQSPPAPPNPTKSNLGRSVAATVLLGSAAGAAAYIWWYAEIDRWGLGPVLPGSEKKEAVTANKSQLIDSTVSDRESQEPAKDSTVSDVESNEPVAPVSVTEKEDVEAVQEEADVEEIVAEKSGSSEINADPVPAETVHACALEGNVSAVPEVDVSVPKEHLVSTEGAAAVMETNYREISELAAEAAGEEGTAEFHQTSNQSPEGEIAADSPTETKAEIDNGEVAVAAMAANLEEDASKIAAHLDEDTPKTAVSEPLPTQVDAGVPATEQPEIESVKLAEVEARFAEASESLSHSSLASLPSAAENSSAVEQIKEVTESLSAEATEEERNRQFAALAYGVMQAALRAQSEVDSEAFLLELEKLKAAHVQELSAVFAEKDRLSEVSEKQQAEIRRLQAEFEWRVEQLEQKHWKEKEAELSSKAKEAARELEEAKLMAEAELEAAVVAEKGQNLSSLAELDLQLKGLQEAFFHKSEESKKGHLAHKIAMCVLSLEESASDGLPLKQDVEVLRASAGQDPLIGSVLNSLPQAVVEAGVATRAQLAALLSGLEPELRTLAVLPLEGGGVLAHALAGLASAIKAAERGTELPGGGAEAVISQAHSLLQQGKLLEAAGTVEAGLAGSKAEPLARRWAEQARNRAIVEQTVVVVHAYAAALASSLS